MSILAENVSARIVFKFRKMLFDQFPKSSLRDDDHLECGFVVHFSPDQY